VRDKPPAFDVARLERVVKALAAEHREVVQELAAQAKEMAALTTEHAALAAEHAALVTEHTALAEDHAARGRSLDEAMAEGRALGERLLAERQQRQDALARLDEVIRRVVELVPGSAPNRAG